jgi:hypothetical protein
LTDIKTAGRQDFRNGQVESQIQLICVIALEAFGHSDGIVKE